MGKYVFKGPFRLTGCFEQNWGYWAPPRAPHRGLDLVGDDDITIYSPCVGTVEHAGDAGDGFGIYVKIHNSDGNHHYFCHMRETAVKAGQKVGLGDKLGVMGHTGNVTGAHTHYEIRDDGGNIHSAADYLGLPNKQGSYNLTAGAPAQAAPAVAKAAPVTLPLITTIDKPAEGETVTGSFVVGGWAISPAIAHHVDIYADVSTPKQVKLATVILGNKREDVAKAYPVYQGSGWSGYNTIIPVGKLAPGAHTINVAGIDRKGGVRWAAHNFKVK